MIRSLWGSKARQEQRDDGAYDSARGLITLEQPTSAASEAYRSIRTNLLYGFVDHPKVILLTSAGPGEGKSTTCANLGVVLAQAAKDTLILDCDLRRPVIHKFFEVRNVHGIMDVMVGERGLQEVWHEPIEGLKVVTVGQQPVNPAEILGTRYFSQFLASLREKFDYVLIDASPVVAVSDPAIIATQGDGVLLVVDAQNTRRGALRQSVRLLEAVGANILGTVMNNAILDEMSYYYGDYSYGSKEEPVT